MPEQHLGLHGGQSALQAAAPPVDKRDQAGPGAPADHGVSLPVPESRPRLVLAGLSPMRRVPGILPRRSSTPSRWRLLPLWRSLERRPRAVRASSGGLSLLALAARWIVEAETASPGRSRASLPATCSGDQRLSLMSPSTRAQARGRRASWDARTLRAAAGWRPAPPTRGSRCSPGCGRVPWRPSACSSLSPSRCRARTRLQSAWP